jgi:hypothetical protein
LQASFLKNAHFRGYLAFPGTGADSYLPAVQSHLVCAI